MSGGHLGNLGLNLHPILDARSSKGMKDAINNHRGGNVGASQGLEELLGHQDWLGRLASQLVRGGTEAQDLVQETLLVGSSTPPPAGVELRAWLGGVARNIARSRGRAGARRTAREQEVARDVRGPSALTEVTTIERQRDLLDALMELPEAQRRVVMARYYEGWPPRRIASEFGLPVATVKSQILRGLATLRARLDATYGDRKSWVLAFLPLARSTGARAGGVLAGKGLAAAALVLGGVSAWGFSHLAASQGDPGAMLPRAVESVALTGAAAPVAVLEPTASPAGGAGPRTSASMGASQIAVRAVVASTGADAPVLGGYSVELAREMAERKASGHPLESFEDLASAGDPFVTGPEGGVFAEGEFPLVIHVVSGELSGYAMATGEEGTLGEVVVSLERAEPLVIRLVDAQGEPLEGTFPVAFDARLPSEEYIPLSPDGHLSASGSIDWVTQGRNVVGGERSVRFLDHMRDPAHPVFPARAAQLRAFHVNVPGLLEFYPELAAFRNEVRMPVPQGAAIVELVAPDMGSVEVHVTASSLAAEVEGTATLRWLDAPALLPDRKFEVPLVAGRARWPLVVAGAHPFSIELNAKSRGQVWSVQGVGPESAGDAVTLESELSANPAVLVRVVGPAGEPLVPYHAWLRHGVPSPYYWDHCVTATNTAGGELVFPLEGGEVLEPPYVLEVHRNGPTGSLWASADLALTAEEARLGKDLGVIELVWIQPITVQGRVVDTAGEPVPQAVVSLTRNGGMGSLKQVDADGHFELSNGFGDEETLRVHVMAAGMNLNLHDRGAPPQLEQTVAPHEWMEPLVLVVEAGPSVEPEPPVEMRRIEVRWPHWQDPVTGKLRQSLDCTVLDGEGLRVGTRTDNEVLLPMGPVDPSWTLWVSSQWCRPQSYVVSELGEVLELVLPTGITTSFMADGELPMDSTATYERVSGGLEGGVPGGVGYWNERALLPRAIHDGDHLDVPFPQGGRYELVIFRRKRRGDGNAGDNLNAVTLRTGRFIDVFDPDGTLPQGMTPEMARERNGSLTLEF